MTTEDITTKRCTKCGEEKPASEYSKNSASKDGLLRRCKSCMSAASLAWYEANKDRAKKTSDAWREANRDRVNAASVSRYAANPDHHRATVARWRERNPERDKEICYAWRAKNKDRLRINEHNYRSRKVGRLSPGLAKKLFHLQRGKCACCGLPLGDDYHLDHRMPLALGGSNTDDNMQLLRKQCNLQKNAKHPIDFMQSRGFLL